MENKIIDHPGNIVYHNCLNCVHCVPALPLIGHARLMCDIINIGCRLEPATSFKPYNKCIMFKLKLQDNDTKCNTLQS